MTGQVAVMLPIFNFSIEHHRLYSFFFFLNYFKNFIGKIYGVNYFILRLAPDILRLLLKNQNYNQPGLPNLIQASRFQPLLWCLRQKALFHTMDYALKHKDSRPRKDLLENFPGCRDWFEIDRVLRSLYPYQCPYQCPYLHHHL